MSLSESLAKANFNWRIKHSVSKLRRDFPNCLAAASNEVAQDREILVILPLGCGGQCPSEQLRPITDSPSVCLRASRLQTHSGKWTIDFTKKTPRNSQIILLDPMSGNLQ